MSLSIGATTPMIHQSEASECALACLAMVMGRYGHHTDLVSLRRQFGTSIRGATLQDLMTMADGVGLNAHPLRADLDYLKEAQVPAILHWKFNHFVVLVGFSRGKALIHDPVSGKRHVSMEELNSSFTGVLVEMTPGEDFRKQRNTAHLPLRWLRTGRPGAFSAIGWILALSLLLQGASLVPPLLLQLGIDSLLPLSNGSLIAAAGVGFALVALLSTASDVLRGYLISRFSGIFQYEWAGKLAGRLVRLPMTYFQKRHLGDVISRFSSVDSVQTLLTTALVEGVVDGLMAFAALGLMFVYSPLLAMVSLCLLVALGLFQLVMSHRIRSSSDEFINALAQNQTDVVESVRGMQAIRLFNAEPQREAILRRSAAVKVNAGMRVDRLQAVAGGLERGLAGVDLIAVVSIGLWLVLAGEFTVGMLVAYVAWRTHCVSSMSRLISKFVDLRMIRLHLDRMGDIASTDRDESIVRQAPDLPAPSGHIVVKDAGFRYSESLPWVFRGVSFEVLPGQCLVLHGTSGCGKSSLLRAMLGLLPLTEGTITVDGTPMQATTWQWLRRHSGCVMQDDTLFSGSIHENVAFNDPSPNSDRIHEACRLAQLADDVAMMPMGYATLVGDMGSALSGGQKQRLLLARALYRAPRLLFLDESSSHLDALTEKRVNRSLRELSVTRISVAHRAESIQDADITYRMPETVIVSPDEAAVVSSSNEEAATS